MIGWRRHLRDHLGLQHVGSRQAEEDVGALDHVGQRLRIGVLQVALLVDVEPVAGVGKSVLGDHALAVAHEDVGTRQTEADLQVEARDRRGARARAHQLHVADLLADDLQSVQHRRRGHDRGAVLVVVEDRDLHALAQLLLDVEALGRLDVLEVDAAERGLERGHDLHQLVGIGLVDLDVEHVDAGELLEEATLAFHHRLARERTDVAEAEHRGAVGDDRDQVAARRVLRGQRRILLDRRARVGDAGRIGERQITLVGERLGRRDRDLPGRRVLVIVERVDLQLVFGHVVSGWNSSFAETIDTSPRATKRRRGMRRRVDQGPRATGTKLAESPWFDTAPT